MPKLAAVFLFASILAACGGGGGGSGSMPPAAGVPVSGGVPAGAPPPTTAPASTPAATPAQGATPTHGATSTPAATSSPTIPTAVATDVPYHIANWAYDQYGSYAQGSSAPGAQVRLLLSYAESGVGNGKPLADCATLPKQCKSVVYFNPNIEYDSRACPKQPDATVIAASSENWWVHYPGSTTKRIGNSNYHVCGQATPVYADNENTPAFRAWWNAYLQANADQYDAYFMDSTGWNMGDQFYASGGFCQGQAQYNVCTATEEFNSDQSVILEHINFVASLSHSNGAPMNIVSNRMPPVSVFQTAPRFIGGVMEDYLISFDTLRPALYSTLLQTMAWNDATPAFTVLLVTGNSPAGTPQQITERFVTTAAAWLGYSEGHVVVWKDLEWKTNGLSVWPEDLIYPSQPVQTMASGPSDLQVSAGVWRREFRKCGFKGAAFGRCAAILNSTAQAVAIPPSWLTQTYSHQVSVTGGDVLSGGQLSLTATPFTAGSSTVPPYGAVLLTP